MALGERKRQVLKMITESYIRSGEPIGSKAIVEQLDNAVSSATIRNDMADLSVMGLLEQPHTSAGRIPTVMGFRVYIDQLMPRQRLDDIGRREIDALLATCAHDPEKMVDTVSKTLAEETHCAAMSTTPYEQNAPIHRIELIPMSSFVVAVILMTRSGTVRNRVARFDLPIDMTTLDRVANKLRERFVGASLADVHMAQMQSVMTALDTDGFICAPVLSAFAELAEEMARSELLLSGQMNLLQCHELSQENAHGILQFLMQREQLIRMLADHSDGLRVLLGAESPRPELVGSGIIVARYAGGNSSGSIGVIGPLRMDYARWIPRIEYLAGAMGRILSELADR